MDIAMLRQLINEHFDEAELQDLCFDLTADYDSLPAVGKSSKARELISLMQRQGRMDDLLIQLKKHRPHLDWPELLPGTPAATPLDAYHHQIVQTLAAPDKEFDTRFVQLTLLLNKEDEGYVPGWFQATHENA